MSSKAYVIIRYGTEDDEGCTSSDKVEAVSLDRDCANDLLKRYEAKHPLLEYGIEEFVLDQFND